MNPDQILKDFEEVFLMHNDKEYREQLFNKNRKLILFFEGFQSFLADMQIEMKNKLVNSSDNLLLKDFKNAFIIEFFECAHKALNKHIKVLNQIQEKYFK